MSHIKNKFPKLAFALVNHCLPSSSTNLFKREMASNQAKNFIQQMLLIKMQISIIHIYISQILANGYIKSNYRIQNSANHISYYLFYFLKIVEDWLLKLSSSKFEQIIFYKTFQSCYPTKPMFMTVEEKKMSLLPTQCISLLLLRFNQTIFLSQNLRLSASLVILLHFF